MTYDYPSYYEKFHCVGGSCKDSCCIGWEVDIDEDTYDYYRSVEGPFGDRLRSHMKDDGSNRYFPMCEDGRCPFLNKSNLCDIIIELGEESLSLVCTEYPRYFLEEGSFEQIDLSLSCMELGRIFFSDPDPIEYIRGEVKEAQDDGAGPADDGDEVFRAQDSVFSGILPQDARLLHEILDIRDDCIGIMEDRDLPLGSRFLEVFRLYGPAEWKARLDADRTASFPGLFASIIDLDDLLGLMDRLEVLDGRWTDEMASVRSSLPGIVRIMRQTENPEGNMSAEFSHFLPDVWFEKLGCYFLFRYVTDAYFSEKSGAAGPCPAQAEEPQAHNTPDIGSDKETEFCAGTAAPEAEGKAPQSTGAAESHPGVAASVRLTARSIYFLYIMCLSRYLERGSLSADDMIDLAHLYSKQVVHSDDNVDMVKACAPVAS